ncbi:uncharacterized protein LOC128035539 [Gossypium raimondii]|uniref:uncharacterized protein LOC128035539 n=1 Tax=Gossypium raimondii TaxID=29730 RepID=UPI00227BDB06|nr:uncharacterized protein LOC128035539 [Gossypium raimondii]
MKVKVVCRKLYDDVQYDLKEIVFPSSLPDPPHFKKRRKLTWHERFLLRRDNGLGSSRAYPVSPPSLTILNRDDNFETLEHRQLPPNSSSINLYSPLTFNDSDTDRDEIGGSSSNGRNQDDSLIKHGEYWAQHDELHGACFNASEVTTGKTNDNTNDGIAEISDDERLDKMEFSSNIWEHVESDDFMERVCQGLDSRPSSLGGNQAMLIQLPSHILPLNHDPLILPAGRVGDHVDNDHHGVRPLNHDPLISSARRVGDHVDSDHHGLCVPENMEDSQKV